MKERHINLNSELSNKNSFFQEFHYRCFLFVAVIVSLLVTTLVMHILCKHMKLKTLVTSLALQQIKEVGAVSKQEHISMSHDIECKCKTQWYTICMLIISLLGIVVCLDLNIRKLKVFRGHLLSMQ